MRGAEYRHFILQKTEANPPAEMAGVTRAAGIIATGNVASRVLGLVRDTVKSNYFGASGAVSAFDMAAKVPMWIYDLLAGGMLSAALVPVFSEYARAERRAELWQVASFLLTISAIALAVLTLLGELFAPQLAWLVGGGLSPELLQLTTSLLRLTLPTMLFLNLAGILAGLLFALQRFTRPAFNAAMFNLGIVAATLLFAREYGVYAMAGGMLCGAALQLLLQYSGLLDARLVPVLNWRQPALQRIARLYLPIVLGLLVDMVSRAVSYRLASSTGDQSIAWMGYATTLMQFPLGLTSIAVSAAILPTLARQAAAVEQREFLQTLAHGLRLVILLIIPAVAGMYVLAGPIVRLLFEHGGFLPADTVMTVIVLRLYLLGVVAAAVDLPLVNAFYARQDAWTPAMVGLAGVGVYLAAAVGPALFRPMQLQDLIVANAVQLTAHALCMWWFLRARVGTLAGNGLLRITLQASAAAALMAAGTLASLELLQRWHAFGGLAGELLLVALPAAFGAAIYFGVLLLARVPEAAQLLPRPAAR